MKDEHLARLMKWEETKGNLKAILHTFMAPEYEEFKLYKSLMDDFTQKVEKQVLK